MKRLVAWSFALLPLCFIVTCSLNAFRPLVTVQVKLPVSASRTVRAGRAPTLPKCVAFSFTAPALANSLSSGELQGYSPTCLKLVGLVSSAAAVGTVTTTGVSLTLPAGQYTVTPIGIETTAECSDLTKIFASGVPEVYTMGVATSFDTAQREHRAVSNYDPLTATNLAAGCVPGSSINAIAAGGKTTCAAVGGAAKCWGNNEFGQLGNNSGASSPSPVPVVGLTSGVTSLATGSYVGHSCAAHNGAAKCWGANGKGQLGIGEISTVRLTPVQVQGLTANVTSVVVGSFAGHSCAIQNGAAYCWGEGALGQLGVGAGADSNIPIAVINFASQVTALLTGSQYGHTCGVQNRIAYCWGSNVAGQLGDGSNVAAFSPIAVNGLMSDVIGAASGSGSAHSCVIMDGGLATCWGENTSGQLGNGNNYSLNYPSNVTGLNSEVTAMALGSRGFTCAIHQGAAKCWGANSYGQLGNNSGVNSNLAVQVIGLTSGVTAITAGEDHACAVHNGALKCWGANDFGQLGDGTTNGSSIPVLVTGLNR